MSEPKGKEKEGEIERQKRLQDDKKRTLSYLKSRIEELDRSMAQNVVKNNFTLASHDAKRMSVILDVLGDIDVTQ